MSLLSTLVSLVLLLKCVQVQGDTDSDHARNFITWEDFMVDEQGITSNVGGRIIVVDQSGKGDSTTVQGAVDMVPQNNTERVKIYIYPGIYRERVHVPKSKPFISFIGKPNITMNEREANITANAQNITEIANAIPIITNSTKASDKGNDGQEMGTVSTATVWVESDFFCATALTIENLVDKDADKRQAVALRVDGDKAVFYRVRLVGEQDTLLDNTGIHYFYRSYIQGSVDFICGNAKSLFHECVLDSVAEFWGAIAAHHRDSADEDTGFSFVNCTIKGSGSVFLGRAWGKYAATTYSFCDMDHVILPLGWSDWGDPSRQGTAMFGEYECSGKGSNRTERVNEQRLAVKSSHNQVRVITVNQNGGGHSKTVQGAVNMVPDNNRQRVKIFIFPGIYREKVRVPVTKPYVSFIGKRNRTASPIITWNSKSSDKGPNGTALGTYASATVGVDSDYFCATGITFENSVIASAGGKGMQGVALRVSSPKAMFYRVRIKGTQDTLLDSTGNHYFLKCRIIGKVDFICGSAKSLYEKCRLQSIAENYGAIAAHHRDSPTDDTVLEDLAVCTLAEHGGTTQELYTPNVIWMALLILKGGQTGIIHIGRRLQCLLSINAREEEQIEDIGCLGQNHSAIRKQVLSFTRAS
ncbi:Pectinesterase QRT1 [Glycine max]|nr:Pectinesterase QRT1 [Glycine max]